MGERIGELGGSGCLRERGLLEGDLANAHRSLRSRSGQPEAIEAQGRASATRAAHRAAIAVRAHASECGERVVVGDGDASVEYSRRAHLHRPTLAALDDRLVAADRAASDADPVELQGFERSGRL